MSIATALTALANDVDAAKAAITAKGGTAPNGTADMAGAIAAIPSGGITPTGNINITDTNVTDVTNYATAQVVDADLIAENIKKDVNILGVVGSFEGGGGLPSNVIIADITPVADTKTISIANTANITNATQMIITSDITAIGGTKVYLHSGQYLPSTHAGITFGQDASMGHFIIANGTPDYWNSSFSAPNITSDLIIITIRGNSNGYFKAGAHYQVIIQGVL